MQKAELEELKEKVSCAAVVEQAGFALDAKESARRAMKYRLDVLRKSRFTFQPAGRYQLTDAGIGAARESEFNRLVMEAIEGRVFSEGITFRFLDQVVMQLLEDMIPPTPIKIQERAAMLGKAMKLDVPTRLALPLLPSTGQFLKGSAEAMLG